MRPAAFAAFRSSISPTTAAIAFCRRSQCLSWISKTRAWRSAALAFASCFLWQATQAACMFRMGLRTQWSVSVLESAGSATIEVQRTDGSDGAVSVAYAVTGGTAVDGTDYQSVSGVLSWNDGDAANKTFTVPVFNNAVISDSKTVVITLASPTGGSVLGTNILTTLTIYDNDQPRRRAVKK